MAHEHTHQHGGGNIKVAFFLNLTFTLFEILGGFYVNSVSILSDALHDAGDSLSLGLSWYLDKKSKKSGDRTYTFGYQRFSLLGALINSLVLILGSVFVIWEAVQRLRNPEHTDAQGMLLFAIVGVLVNGYAAFKISKGKSLNEKVLQWHLLEDMLGWVAVLLVSIVMIFQDIHILDPILSLCITLYVLWNVFKRLKETMVIFLQGAPEKIDVEEINTKLTKIDNVGSVHHTHIWSLDGEHHVLTTHLKLQEVTSPEEILEVKNKVKERLKDYPLEHITIETEFEQETCTMDTLQQTHHH